MSRASVTPKQGGQNAEAAVIQRVPEIRHVPDSEAEYCDARTTTLLEPSADLPFGSILLLEAGTDVEIKSVMAAYGKHSDRGRFYLRQRQHEKLLDAAGSYLFAVCEPKPSRDPVALKVVPASIVDSLVSSWIDVAADRAEQAYAQLAWSRIFDPAEVEG